MVRGSEYLKALLEQLRKLREDSGLTAADVENKLLLGPGWITRFETAQTIPGIETILAILHVLRKTPADLLRNLPDQPAPHAIQRGIYGEQSKEDLLVHFRYGEYDAVYTLPRATKKEFDQVIKCLRDGLARLAFADEVQTEAIKTDSVASAFLKSVAMWPHANPSDLWWFLIYRAYCDPYNHPAEYARLDLPQSWKRTGG